MNRADTPTDWSAARDAKSITQGLELLQRHVPLRKRLLHAGDALYRSGQDFEHLYVLNSGLVKLVRLAADGREQVVALQFRGDWLGLDGIAKEHYGCDAVALDTGEAWAVRYDDLLHACARTPALLKMLHEAMSREIGRERDAMMSLATLPADARVAEFLRGWADALAVRGLRTDQITLRMTRAEIGNHLGMTLETVSRALSKLERGAVIRFEEKGRRDIRIPCLEALGHFVQRSLAAERPAAPRALPTARPPAPSYSPALAAA